MAIELKQSLKLSQQLVMTPQLQQAIKLLQLTRMELAEHCQTEMMENPMLEEMAEEPETPLEKSAESNNLEDQEFQAGQIKEVDTTKAQGADDINWENYLNSQSYKSVEKGMRDFNPDAPSFESTLTRASTLAEHLMAQLQITRLIEDDEKIGEAIIGNLDEDGYFRMETAELAGRLNCEAEDVEAVLQRIQQFDPVGVGARSLQECLLIQARQFPEDHTVRKILKHHLEDMVKKDYSTICKALKITKKEFTEAMTKIAAFEPKPGRQFYDESYTYITPDIYVYKVNGEYVIMQNEDGMPRLRVSGMYEQFLKGGAAPKGVSKDYINDKLRSAVWLIRSIHQRQRTIYRVTESIVRMQRDFLETGVGALKPMVLRDVAADIGMHESTVSRVTANKYVHTPQGIFELKFFFNTGIKRVEGVSLASEAVKEKIRELIANENPKQPYSDQELLEMLRKRNIDVARRTIAKYREMLGIESSSRRKQIL